MLGKPPEIVIYEFGTISGTSEILCYARPQVYDSRFFSSPGESQFVCKRAGSYKIHVAGKGGYNGSGTAVSATYYVRKNGTNIITHNSNANAFGTESVATVNLVVGDTITFHGKKGSSGYTRSGLIIEAVAT